MNNNIEEKLVSIQVAKLFKEKGFDVPCHTFVVTEESEYGELDEVITDPDGTFPSLQYNSLYDTLTALPTQAIALEWIRVNFGIHIIVEAQFDENENENGYFFMCYKNNKDKIKYQLEYISGKLIPEIYNTPQEAMDAGLLYTLTKLIP